MKLTPQYISVGCNRGSGTSDVDETGRVAFAAGKVVALWDARDETYRGVYETLPGHDALITKIRFVRDLIVSGDEAGHVRIWRPASAQASGPHPAPIYTCAATIQAHAKSISAISAFPLGARGAGFLLVTGGSDAQIRTWRYTEAGIEPLQTFEAGGRMPLEFALAELPGSEALVLAVALTHRIIQVFTASSPSSKFQPAISLEGHEDWVRCLSVTTYPRQQESVAQGEADLMLASGSQDNYVRLWRISRVALDSQEDSASRSRDASGVGLGADAPDLNDAMLDEFERKMRGEAVDDGDEGAGPSGQISTKAHVIRLEEGNGSTSQYSVNLESVLIGHESWVTNLRWSPPTLHSAPLLLSTAADNSMILWTPPSAASTIWLARHRFGEMGGKGLGLFGALWVADAPDGGWSVVASGWNGGFQRWRLEREQGLDLVECEWLPEIAITGHQNAVEDIAWDPEQDTDRTTRAHAPWSRKASNETRLTTWAEVGRPQIHGYDMTCVAFTDRLSFASGADEKVVRVFSAPKGFADSLYQLGATQEALQTAGTVVGASVPPLGLSNKALTKARDPEPSTDKIPTMNEEHVSISTALDKVPTEAVLAASTLWPEVDKIYGHGYELMTLAVSPNRRILATACKASSSEHAKVILYDIVDGKRLGEPLEGHNLTITRIAFSHGGQHVLTCSRDRTWRLFREKPAHEGETDEELSARRRRGVPSPAGFEPIAAHKPHARIIWDCAWAPDDRFFVTVSRDKQMKVWQKAASSDESWACAVTQKLQEAGTAVAVASRGSGGYIVAVGLETGIIELYSLTVAGDDWKCTLDHRIPHSMAHVGQVNRLAWRSFGGGLELASCSDDRALRITRVAV